MGNSRIPDRPEPEAWPPCPRTLAQGLGRGQARQRVRGGGSTPNAHFYRLGDHLRLPGERLSIALDIARKANGIRRLPTLGRRESPSAVEAVGTSSEQAAVLIEEAERRNLVLMVDHTFIYTDAVRRIKQLVDDGSLGRLYYYDSVRVNLGLFQHDVNVLWDLAVHDLSIMDYVLGESPCAVAATGAAHIPGKPVNTAYLTCFFENNVIAHHHVNWLAPVKLRRTLVCGDRQMIVYDDIEPSEKIKVYDRGVTLTNGPERVAETRIG